MTLRRICVFCGSNVGDHGGYVEAARATGRLLAARGIGLVYGGGRVGLMGVVAGACAEAGGEVIGVIPEALEALEVGNHDTGELRVVGSMHQRKQLMGDLSDAFLALPGGIGTFEELLEVLTWTQLGIHDKPAGILQVDGFWDGLLALLDRAVASGFLRPDARSLPLVASDPADLVDALAAWVPSGADASAKWTEPLEP